MATPSRARIDIPREPVAVTRGRARGDLDTERMLQLSITRLLEIIGEAANRVTAEGRGRYAKIPGQEVVTTRHRIIHGYDTVDYDIVWRILNDERPPLITALERALPGHVT